MSQFFKHLLENEKFKQIQRSDWLVLALVGVLLLVIALPQEKQSETTADTVESKQNDKSATVEESGEETYVAYLEKKLETVLAKMEGVGDVAVMITVSDTGENVVEKDTKKTENESDEETVYVENGSETYPYVQNEKMPTVEGVVVVAEGGGNARVASNISEAVQALLPVEAHRIKVVKMGSKEESN